MKKIMLFLLGFLIFSTSINAEEKTINEILGEYVYSSGTNYTYNAKVGETIIFEDWVNSLTALNTSDQVTEKTLSYDKTLLDEGILVIENDNCKNENSDIADTNIISCSKIDDAYTFGGLKFTKKGIYTFNFEVRSQNIENAEVVNNYSFHFVISDSSTDTEETRNVSLNETFTIDANEIIKTLNNNDKSFSFYDGSISYLPSLLDSTEIRHACDGGRSADDPRIEFCWSNDEIFNDIYFTKSGTYYITVDYVKIHDEEKNILENYTHKIIFNVMEEKEVSKDETKTSMNTLGTIENTKDTTITNSLIVPEDNNLTNIEVPVEEFNQAKENNISLVYEIKDKNDKLSYSWTFVGETLTGNTTSPMNLKLDVEEINEDLKKNFDVKEALLVNFAYHGDLPGEADVKIYVGDKYKPGDELKFYYNNTEKDKIELISEKVIVDKEGYATVTISHCSEYIFNLVKTTPNPNTFDGITIYFLMMIVSLLGVVGTCPFLKKQTNK